MSPIQVGALMGDRAADRGPIGEAYRRVAAVIRSQPLEGASIDLVFDIEGSLNTPDYAAFRVGRVDRKERSIQIWIAVAAAVTGRPRVDAELMDLAEAAMLLAGERLATASIDLDPNAVTDAIRNARLASGLRPRPDGPEIRADGVGDIGLPRNVAVQVRVPLTVDPAVGGELDALFTLEEHLDERLRRERLGHVDGNEIGSGDFAMFLSIRRGGRRRASEILEEVLPPDALVVPPLAVARKPVP